MVYPRRHEVVFQCIEILICVSLVINEAENFFVCLLAICIPFVRKSIILYCIISVSLWLSCASYFLYSRYKFFRRYVICEMFLSFCRLSFHFLGDDVLWKTQDAVISMKSILFIYFILALVLFVSYVGNLLTNSKVQSILFKSLIVLVVKFRSLIHFG